ncbi:hypothetical protein J2Z40_001719 [Cytobacillus eiseniae]|uniref:Uncharacterized protein n=1 Tax=Cytobacillus eiseniae TaxID=762947 RepID=A0ABS4RH39_9BACI|nr:hypothetical protein [Cytobacillus eiseniae]MBP2241157.1 hypothetical protein [Cytobacillus eiseniae]
MGNALIIGTFENIGFHFCTSYLEEGYEVIGIQFTSSIEEEILENKRMAIGRNANFIEKSFKEWLPTATINERTSIIIDLYHFHLRESVLKLEGSEIIEKFLDKNERAINETNSKVIFLLPIQRPQATDELFSRLFKNRITSPYEYLHFEEELKLEKGDYLHIIEEGF